MQPLKRTGVNYSLFILLCIFIPFIGSAQILNNQDRSAEYIRLQNTCHFISKTNIKILTDRYRDWKNSYNKDAQDSMTKIILTDSTSFNNVVVKAILSDKRCVGLRILYGVGKDNKLHAIIVGIKRDYNTLYIARPKGEKCDPAAPNPVLGGTRSARRFLFFKIKDDDDPDDKIGGAEMGQLP